MTECADGLASSKHSGVRSLFNREYVKSGYIPEELARTYNDLFERRQEGDYQRLGHKGINLATI